MILVTRLFGWSPLPALCLLTAAACAAAPSGARDVVQAHLEPTSGTLDVMTWDLPGSSLREDTLAYSLELSLAPAFTIFHTGIPGFMAGDWRLVAVPKIVVRRSDGLPSNPVRTPSYMPAASLYVEPRALASSGGGSMYFSLGVSHYSNGQAGDFLRADGSGLNDVNGSFSLWTQSVSVHVLNTIPWVPEYAALKVDRVSFKEGALDALYPDWIFSLSLHTSERAHDLGLFGGRSRFTADFDWKPRVRSDLPEAWKPVPFSVSLAARYAPDFGTKDRRARSPLGGFALFTRFYAGHDPYNMSFDREIYRVDLGFMAGPGT